MESLSNRLYNGLFVAGRNKEKTKEGDLIATVYIKAPKKSDYKTEEEYEEASLANLEKQLKKFKNLVQKENVLVYYRRKTYFISKGEKEREKKKKGIHKARKRERLNKQYDRE